MSSLYDPLTMDELQLKNRVSMAPLTRNRARPHGVPVSMAAVYCSDAVRGELAVSSGDADAAAYGRLFLANPDLLKRLRHREPINAPDPKTFYGGNAAGYMDYPDRSAHV